MGVARALVDVSSIEELISKPISPSATESLANVQVMTSCAVALVRNSNVNVEMSSFFFEDIDIQLYGSVPDCTIIVSCCSLLMTL